jgi:alkaline phosphatase D
MGHVAHSHATVLQHSLKICQTLTMTTPLSRRMFLALGATVVVAACSSSEEGKSSGSTEVASTAPATSLVPPSDLPSDPFTLGVASGDPDTESVVLWTRLAIDALKGGAMPDEDIDVLWEMSTTESFDEITIAGIATASPQYGHSVHVIAAPANVTGLLHYRFRLGDYTSPIGTTRLSPSSDSLEPVKIASASCQNWTAGFYTAYHDMAELAPDLVLFLGDYIYEGGVGSLDAGAVRLHNSDEIRDLVAYRNRYGLYKSDPLLQAAHQMCPWVVTWDDHEVENNYANLTPEDPADNAGHTARRAAAYQAWWEHMPVRFDPPVDENLTIYRQFSWGSLVNMLVLDTRQYRDDQACNDAVLQTTPACDDALLPERSLLGAEQEAWVAANIRGVDKVWNVLANQTVMTDIRLGAAVLNFDQWDGYAPDRDRVLTDITQQGVENLIVLTGDIHLSGVGQLTTTANPTTAVGIEFVATSISSGGNIPPETQGLLQALPNIIDAEASHRGYILHTITPETWTAQYRIVDDAKVENSGVSDWKTFSVTAGTAAVAEI